MDLKVTNKEYYNMEMQYTRRVSEYESRVKEYETRLQAYENIEKELDEVIMQAAEGNPEVVQRSRSLYGRLALILYQG